MVGEEESAATSSVRVFVRQEMRKRRHAVGNGCANVLDTQQYSITHTCAGSYTPLQTP